MDTITLIASCALFVQGVQSDPACGPVPDPLATVPASIVAAKPAPPQRSLVDQWQSYIAEAARNFSIPAPWIRAVMSQESGGRTTLDGRPITSPAGAMGLMQVMPGTYSDLRRRYALGTDSYDPHDNILAGAAYLREMYERYGYPYLFAAYNAGPKRFDAFLFSGKPLPSETLGYVQSIVPGVETVLSPALGAVSNRPTLPPATPSKVTARHAPEPLFFARIGPSIARGSKASDAPATSSNSRSIFMKSNIVGAGLQANSDGRLFVSLSSNQQ